MACSHVRAKHPLTRGHRHRHDNSIDAVWLPNGMRVVFWYRIWPCMIDPDRRNVLVICDRPPLIAKDLCKNTESISIDPVASGRLALARETTGKCDHLKDQKSMDVRKLRHGSKPTFEVSSITKDGSQGFQSSFELARYKRGLTNEGRPGVWESPQRKAFARACAPSVLNEGLDVVSENFPISRHCVIMKMKDVEK